MMITNAMIGLEDPSRNKHGRKQKLDLSKNYSIAAVSRAWYNRRYIAGVFLTALMFLGHVVKIKFKSIITTLARPEREQRIKRPACSVLFRLL